MNFLKLLGKFCLKLSFIYAFNPKQEFFVIYTGVKLYLRASFVSLNP